jgi:hypothetical protein
MISHPEPWHYWALAHVNLFARETSKVSETEKQEASR